MAETVDAEPKAAAPKLRGKAYLPQGLFHFSMAQLLIALVLMFATAPFIQELPSGVHVESVIISLVLLSAMLAVGGDRTSLVWAVILVTPAVVGKWMNHWMPDLVPAEVYLGASVVFIAFVVLHLLKFTLRAPR